MAITIEYRFYGADGSRRQIYTTAFGTARWKSTRYGGYVESTFTLSGTASQLGGTGGIQPPQEGDRVRVFVNGQLRYSGLVATPNFSVADPIQTTINAYGKYKQVAGITVDGRFISTIPVDVSVAISSFVNAEVRRSFPALYADLGSTDYGLLTQLEDAFNKTFGDVMTTFGDRLEGLAVYGIDEYPTNLGDTPVDRFFLRPVGSLSQPDYTIPIPGPFLGCPVRVQQGGLDNTKLVNVLTVGGSDALYPNYMGGGCNGNVSFERPVFTDQASGKIFGPFYLPKTTSAGGITFGGGASPKSGGLSEGPVYLGDRMVELDHIGEFIQFTQTGGSPFPVTYHAGDTVVAVVVARREKTQNAAQIQVTIQWRNGASAVGAPITFTYDLMDAVWRDWSSQFAVPSSPVTQFDFIVTATSVSGGTGAVIGTGYAYVSKLKQDGWAVIDQDGTGRINSIDYINTSNAKQGRYSISIDANGSDVDGHAVLIRPVAVCKLPGGMPLIFSWYIKLWPGTVNGKIFLSFYCFRADGTQTGGVQQTTINAGTYSDADGWIQINSFVTAPNDTASCTPLLAFRGPTQCYVDAGMVRSQSIPVVATVPRTEYEWIDVGAYRTIFRTDDALFAGSAFAASIADNDPFYATVQNDSVYDYFTASYLAQQYFGAFGKPYAHPILEIDNCPITFVPGQTVKLAGVLGPWISGGDVTKVFIIAEVEEIVQSSGILTTTLYLDKENPSTERIVREMIRKFHLALTGAGANTGLSARGSTIGGGNVGGQAGYTSVQQGAVAAPTRNVINFIGGGVTVADNDPNGSTDVTIAQSAGVTSVGLILPTSVFNVTGTPVTSQGTPSATFIGQPPGTFFAAPGTPNTGPNLTPVFKSIDDYDLPDTISSVARVQVQNAGSLTGTRKALNFIGATSVADNPAQNRVDVTLPSGGAPAIAGSPGQSVFINGSGFAQASSLMEENGARVLIHSTLYGPILTRIQAGNGAGLSVDRIGVPAINNTLGILQFGVFDNGIAINYDGPEIIGYADENWAGGVQGAGIQFAPTLNGGSVRSIRLTLNNRGDLSFSPASGAFGIRTGNVTSASVTTPLSGAVIFDTTLLKYYDGSVWRGIAPIWTISAQSANYVIPASTYFVRVQMDATAGNRTVTLPAVSGMIGQEVSISKVDVGINTVTVLAGGTDTLNIVAGINILNAQWQSITLVGTAGGWEVI